MLESKSVCMCVCVEVCGEGVCRNNVPKVMYPTLFPVSASVPCSSSGGSECEKRTWGAVWLPLRPSLNSCMKTFPMTTSSSSVNIVENMTVTRSFWADTYLCV